MTKNCIFFKNKLDVSERFVYSLPRTPSRGGSKGERDTARNRPSEAIFNETDFPWHHAGAEMLPAPDTTFREGCRRGEKRGKEKVVTRAVAYARMVPKGAGAGTRY